MMSMACYVVGVVYDAMPCYVVIIGMVHDVTMACYVVGVVCDVTMATMLYNSCLHEI